MFKFLRSVEMSTTDIDAHRRFEQRRLRRRWNRTEHELNPGEGGAGIVR